MVKLDLRQIADKLNMEFIGDIRKIVFWYDSNADFKDDIDSLILDNAKILKLEPDNQFQTKYYLECVDTTTNYLVYAPFAKPGIRENHLEDTIRYSKEFFADRASLIAVDLGINDSFKPVLQKYVNAGFFNEKDRTERFYNYSVDNYNQSTIEIALMCSLCKLKVVSFEQVVRCVITESDLIDNKYLAEFEKYDLVDAFWRHVEITFGISASNPTLEKMLTSMFITYYLTATNCNVPDHWKGYVSYKSGSITVFLDEIMNSAIYGKSFDRISVIIFNLIKGENVVNNSEIEKLITCSLFPSIDKKILVWMCNRLKAEDVGVRVCGKTIPEVCAMRRNMHYGDIYQHDYYVMENAYNIIAYAKFIPSNSIEDLTKAYLNQWFKIDRYYRYFYYHLDLIDDPSAYDQIQELVENIYTNDYLNKITVNWNDEFKKMNTGLSFQRSFFMNNIKSSKEKTVVIISDAMRYEVAHSLYQKLFSDEKCKATITAIEGVLPSYTPLGMASLLPHSSIEYTDSYDVLVDGKNCATTEQRQNILQNYIPKSKCVQFDLIKNMKQAELRTVFTGQDVVYIYHNQIDARGDAAKTENEVFTACEEAINEIYTVIKRVSSMANTYHFFVTSDHGFIYKRDRLDATDKISGITSKSNSVGQRYCVSKVPVEAEGVCHTTIGRVLGTSDERTISYPLASDIFKVPGAGQNFVHGGCSPQEMLVPLVKVKVEKRKTETKTVEITPVNPGSKITNLKTILDFMQTEPVSDTVKKTTYRIYFVTEDNEKISNENFCIADKKDTDSRNRIFRLRFDFKTRRYNPSTKYYLVAYDDNSDIELFRYEMMIDIAFADDYGF